jgi:hypothetical protein
MKQLGASYKVQLAFFAFITVMLVARVFYSGTLMYLFLIWNLFLAKKLPHKPVLILCWRGGYYFFQMLCTSLQT